MNQKIVYIFGGIPLILKTIPGYPNYKTFFKITIFPHLHLINGMERANYTQNPFNCIFMIFYLKIILRTWYLLIYFIFIFKFNDLKKPILGFYIIIAIINFNHFLNLFFLKNKTFRNLSLGKLSKLYCNNYFMF